MAAVSIDAAVGAWPPSATHLAAPQCAIPRLTSPCTAAVSLVFTSTLHPIFSVRTTTNYYKCSPVSLLVSNRLCTGPQTSDAVLLYQQIFGSFRLDCTKIDVCGGLQKIRQSTKTNEKTYSTIRLNCKVFYI